MSRRGWMTGTGVALAAGALAAGAFLAFGRDGSSTAAAGSPASATAGVERRTLVSRETVSGTLGYADERSVRVRSGAERAAGTVTSVVREGARLSRGQAIYRVDGEAVRLLIGDTPAWRTMQQGDRGGDIGALEFNLRKLGYDPGTVDGDFDASTAAAVRAWQDDTGWEVTGRVDLGQVVIQPGRRRAGEVMVKTGEVVADGAEVMRTTSRRREVVVDLDADQQTLARRGATVEVTLPGDRTVDGKVTSVGSVAKAAGAGGETDEEASPTITVKIALTTAEGVGRLDGAPVSVGLAAEVSRNVLAVPVTALLAVRGGGYAVQVRTRAGTRTVPVDVGQFADGLVGVAGEGLRSGDEVVVPDAI